MDGAVAGAGNEQACAVDVGHARLRVSRVVRTPRGRAYPYGVAGALVESHEANPAIGLRAPGRAGRAQDHEVSIDDG